MSLFYIFALVLVSFASNYQAPRALEPNREKNCNLEEYTSDLTLLGFETNQTPSEKEVERNFRKIAIKYHPDRNQSPEAAAKFKDINNAQARLKLGKPSSNYNFNTNFSSSRQPYNNFDDLFNELFGQNSGFYTFNRPTEAEKKINQDLYTQTLEEIEKIYQQNVELIKETYDLKQKVKDLKSKQFAYSPYRDCDYQRELNAGLASEKSSFQYAKKSLSSQLETKKPESYQKLCRDATRAYTGIYNAKTYTRDWAKQNYEKAIIDARAEARCLKCIGVMLAISFGAYIFDQYKKRRAAKKQKALEDNLALQTEILPLQADELNALDDAQAEQIVPEQES